MGNSNQQELSRRSNNDYARSGAVTDTMSSQSDFFVDGGTLRPHTPSYVTRPADQELLERVLEGQFCYVLTARQMGKSSLMVRTVQRLQGEGIATAIVDLSEIGTQISREEWYLGIMTRLARDLRLPVELGRWWHEHRVLGAVQRFTDFLHDIALAEIKGRIVIFIDEIDTTLNLNFRDDFFAAIRAMHKYNRLAFVLLGVATPTDLIKDRNRTPFNVGHRIVLQEFSYADATPLQEGLEAVHTNQGDRILGRIFYWTNGHPYLTQKLCLIAAQAPKQIWDEAKVDELVRTNFFSDEARTDSNLAFVENRIRASPAAERRGMLNLYREVYVGKTVLDDDRSPTQNYLELFGLVRVEAGRLHVRNRIYHRVFNLSWIRANMPPDRARLVLIGIAVIAILAIVLVVIFIQR